MLVFLISMIYDMNAVLTCESKFFNRIQIMYLVSRTYSKVLAGEPQLFYTLGQRLASLLGKLILFNQISSFRKRHTWSNEEEREISPTHPDQPKQPW